ncbi:MULTISPECIES: ATP-dependent Clp protease adaptor ClpS [Runella]|uniref:ATP-dependent Clp protease adaptor protein ClpS n=1 Tax=Runella defluvii TaxID=370973 RepID=A0A7W6ESX2_9BACT|nr:MULTISPECIES: ATP-dependent Clp protease adaptor ClpS [Runella]MCA0229916.1 ATP-dependent Clp protease adaptor ClpS [Bacteroidota bacterium]HAK78495.1 ATP-dependent Clp protease adaptor ClpS [Runella sp.]AYQ31479.1 ATP-dependent Clp protease adaptor ClpS [Runella sp. SP2]MBB3841154.1 ATP-dependent Clp protease adaptor protein ClpS [Runella defluvii]HAO51016.1 ATP-dependent Clp protease adaptor ClpS [Runella sp.]
MQLFEMPEVDVVEEVEQKVVETDLYSLVVFNDEVNTFDWVIETLMDVCEHTPEQAEQCTIIIHYKGKCRVKNGSWEELVPKRQEICRRGISAEIL